VAQDHVLETVGNREPRARREQVAQEWGQLHAAVARLRASIMSVVFGFAGGVGLWLATIWLVIRGGDVVGPHLALLSNYFPGYTVTWVGAFVGLFYGALAGGLVGWVLAWLYNKLADLRSAR
jgi:hypothetical protein